MIASQRFWRGVMFLVRADIAASLAMTAALLLWPSWHS
jgi:hypothetical protein